MRYSQRVNAIFAERDQQLIAIASLRSQPQANSRYIETAQTLLTRHWGRAGWSEREELLRASAWVLKLHQLATARVHVGRRRPRKAGPIEKEVVAAEHTP